MVEDPFAYNLALNDFQNARRKAAMEQLLARFSGKPTELLSYEEVRQQLHLTNQASRGLQDVPLDKIVGSVGRYQDFTRSFLPRQDSAERRWVTVRTAVDDLKGVPPIEVYQIGDAYFVIDGNHRVSIARQLGAPTISAYVTEVKTRVPLSAEDDLDEIICKARYSEFLEITNLDKLKPDANLLMTFSGQYRIILEHIAVHRYYMGIKAEAFVPYEDAVASWYDNVYLPIIYTVREQGVLRYFPNRREADMYVLLAEYRAELEDILDWEVAPETAVAEITKQNRSPIQALMNMGSRLVDAIIPDELEGAPPPGTWRIERVNKRSTGRLFDDILVPLTPNGDDWRALDMGIWVAKLGQSRLFGLHVMDETDPNAQETAEEIKQAFIRRCDEAGVSGQFAMETGLIGPKIVQRSIYADGIIIPFNHSPETVSERLSSGLQTILRRSPRPVLTVPPLTGPAHGAGPLTHALLAYGGVQTTADEALYVAAYLNARYQIKLSVLSVGSNIQTNKALAHVREYLHKLGAEAEFYAEEGPVEQIVLDTAVKTGADFLVMGSLSYSPIRSLLFGSTANRLLSEYPQPILICR